MYGVECYATVGLSGIGEGLCLREAGDPCWHISDGRFSLQDRLMAAQVLKACSLNLFQFQATISRCW